MIKENSKLGKHTINTLAEMGKGDIEIWNHISQEESKVYITFHNGKGEIGAKAVVEGKTSDDLQSIPIALSYTNPDSINALIRMLQEAKENLNEIINNKNIKKQ